MYLFEIYFAISLETSLSLQVYKASFSPLRGHSAPPASAQSPLRLHNSRAYTKETVRYINKYIYIIYQYSFLYITLCIR